MVYRLLHTRRGAVALLGIVLLVPIGCSTRGESPRLPRFSLPRGAEAADPVYTGNADMVYRTAFEAIVAEFDTSPRIVKPERGLIVFGEAGAQANTSVVISAVGEDAAAVHIEIRDSGKLLSGRRAKGVRTRIIRALDERLARAEEVAPVPAAPRGTSALAEKQEALERIQAGLGFAAPPGYLVDLEAPDLRHLADAIDRRLGARAMTVEERRTSAELVLALGKELHDLGRYDEARDALEHATALLPRSAAAHCNLGEIYKHLRDFDRCLSHLRDAERLDPEYAETYINLGIVYDDYVIDDAQALANYQKYLELGGTDPRVQDWIRALTGAG